MQLKADHIMDVCSWMPSWVCLLQAMFLQSHQKENTWLPHSCPVWTSTAQPCLLQRRDVQHVLVSCVICGKYQLCTSMNIPCTCIPSGTLLPTPKDGAEIRNQGKPGSLKWTRHCSINWQEKIARQSENLNNGNTEKILWMETYKPQRSLGCAWG